MKLEVAFRIREMYYLTPQEVLRGAVPMLTVTDIVKARMAIEAPGITSSFNNIQNLCAMVFLNLFILKIFTF